MNQVVLPWPEPQTLRTWFIRLAGVVLLLYVIYLVREIWLPIGLAFLLATILDPVVDRMEARGWKRTPASCAIFFSTITIVVLLVVLATPHVIDQLGSLQQAFAKYFPDTSQEGLTNSLVKQRVPKGAASLVAQSFVTFQHGFTRSSSWMTEYGANFVSNLVWVVIVPIVAFYALRDYHLLLGKALLLAPSRHRESVQIYVSEVSGVFSRYLRGLAIVSVLNGLATWVFLAALHVPSSLLLGVVAGILYSVPYIGALITVVLTSATAFVGGGVDLLLYAVIGSMIIHQLIFDQLITPRILGGHVGIHPIISIVALLVGNLLLGIVGMILAVPVAACIQIGVLALVPKLKTQIDFNAETSALSQELAHRSAESKEEHIKVDITESLHGSIVQAVENVEAQLEVERTDPEAAT